MEIGVKHPVVDFVVLDFLDDRQDGLALGALDVQGKENVVALGRGEDLGQILLRDLDGLVVLLVAIDFGRDEPAGAQAACVAASPDGPDFCG